MSRGVANTARQLAIVISAIHGETSQTSSRATNDPPSQTLLQHVRYDHRIRGQRFAITASEHSPTFASRRGRFSTVSSLC